MRRNERAALICNDGAADVEGDAVIVLDHPIRSTNSSFDRLALV